MSVDNPRDSDKDDDPFLPGNSAMDYQKKKDNRESAFGARNTLEPEDLKRRVDMIDGLQEFQTKTGIDESKYIKELKDCNKKSALNLLEKKFKKAWIKWYELQMKKSGVFETLDVREETLISQEMDGLVKWFSELPLYGDTSMISTLNQLEENLRVKKTFREKLKKQSKFVQGEYFRRLGSLALVGSREQLLENILKEIKDVEGAPSAVQYEFKKKQKSAGASKATADIKKEVLEAHQQRFHTYRKMVLDNQNFFGGDLIRTPLGKIPSAVWEFLEWFEERENFAAMDEAIKKLPSLVKQRKRLYEKRDAILKSALPKDRKKLTEQTNRMRRHELEEFLPEMEKHIRKNSVHVAEFMADILTARTYNIDLYEPLERTLEIRKFKLNDLETQKAKLLVLQDQIQDRERVVREYFSLPSHVRDDQKFLRANAFEREKMLLEGKERLNREKDNPFDATHVDHMDGEELEGTAEKLGEEKGELLIEDILEEMGQEGLLKAVDVQKETHKKIFGAAKSAKNKEETQKEHYLRDLKYWVRLRQDVKDESDVSNQRERNKWRYIQTANEAYDMDYVFTSGGEVRKLETVSTNDLKYGNKVSFEKLERAKYGEHVKITDHEGKMAEDPLELIEKLSAQELMKLVLLAINKLGKKHMKLSEGNLAVLRNSPNIRREIAEQMVEQELTHLEAANNTDHYLNQVAA